MSQEVDFTKPLSDKDRAYLLMRGREIDVARLDEAHGVETDPALLAGDGTGPESLQVNSAEAAADRKRRLLNELAEIERTEQEQGGAIADEGDEEEVPYSAWKVSELDAELKERQLSTDGTKADKVARLEQNDAQTDVPL